MIISHKIVFLYHKNRDAMKKFLALAVLMGIAVLPAFAQQEIRSEGSLDFSKADLSGNLTVKMIRSDTARIAIKLRMRRSIG